MGHHPSWIKLCLSFLPCWHLFCLFHSFILLFLLCLLPLSLSLAVWEPDIITGWFKLWQYIFKTNNQKWSKPMALLGCIWNQLNLCDIKYTYIYALTWDLTLLFLLMPGRPRDCLALTALHGRLRVPERSEWAYVFVVFCSPGTASGLLTELPSGGSSPTMLGSWALGGGENTGGLGPCSWSNFFGTSKREK